MTIGVVDYGMGNLGSVSNALTFLGQPGKIIASPAEMERCDAVILPGVGAFGDCMAHLQQHGFVEPIRKWIAADRPFLGICLGLQILFSSSEESPGVQGLSVLPGRVKRFARNAQLKVPQIGWNRVAVKPAGQNLFAGVADGTHFYFVHSFYVECDDPALAAGVTRYGIDYTSAVVRGRLAAVQFHPEKSQSAGLAVLSNFCRSLAGKAAA